MPTDAKYAPVEEYLLSTDQIRGPVGCEVRDEESDIVLPSFRPTLEALQAMSCHGDIPFADLTAPSTDLLVDTDIEVSAPTYTRQPGFRFDLSSIMTTNPLKLRPGKAFDIKSLMDDSTLDETQSKAIINALSRRFALIQGPPGIGKSYVAAQLIKILLASRDDAAMGPIICVSYTNHALDQFLEQLVSEGIENVVRVGSRCKSKILEPFKLEVVATKSGHSKMRKRAHFEASQLRKVTSS